MANEGLGIQTTVCTSQAEAYLYVEATRNSWNTAEITINLLAKLVAK